MLLENKKIYNLVSFLIAKERRFSRFNDMAAQYKPYRRIRQWRNS
jgi:hypothetical protein